MVSIVDLHPAAAAIAPVLIPVKIQISMKAECFPACTGQLFHANSLEPFSSFSPELQKALRLDAQDVKENTALQEGHGVTAIMTNPPFGSKIPIEDPAILETFDLGHSWNYVEDDFEWKMDARLVARPPEILFIERCVRLLEPGVGVAALVIPNGILGNPRPRLRAPMDTASCEDSRLHRHAPRCLPA